ADVDPAGAGFWRDSHAPREKSICDRVEEITRISRARARRLYVGLCDPRRDALRADRISYFPGPARRNAVDREIFRGPLAGGSLAHRDVSQQLALTVVSVADLQTGVLVFR